MESAIPQKVVNSILADNPGYRIAVESNDMMYSNFHAEEIWEGVDYIKTFDFKELEDSYAEKIIVDSNSIEIMEKLKKHMAERPVYVIFRKPHYHYS